MSALNLYNKLLELVADEIDDMTYDEARYWIDRDAVPSSGSVTSLIYTADTEALATQYHDDIIELMNEMDSVNLSLNDMAWFAWEYYILGNGKMVMNDLIDRGLYEPTDFEASE